MNISEEKIEEARRMLAKMELNNNAAKKSETCHPSVIAVSMDACLGLRKIIGGISYAN